MATFDTNNLYAFYSGQLDGYRRALDLDKLKNHFIQQQRQGESESRIGVRVVDEFIKRNKFDPNPSFLTGDQIIDFVDFVADLDGRDGINTMPESYWEFWWSLNIEQNRFAEYIVGRELTVLNDSYSPVIGYLDGERAVNTASNIQNNQVDSSSSINFDEPAEAF